jgi:ribosome-binding protein aMBF1 (putative translation factor)
MNECFICGVSGEKVRLYDAITSEGIEKICHNCSIKENIPIIKKPTSSQLDNAEKNVSFSQKASIQIEARRNERQFPTDKQDASLRELVDRTYASRMPKMENPQIELVDNFHWVIMMARRKKHITQRQLADYISESEAAIRMAERGILPKDDYRLVNKLESFLRVNLRRGNNSKYTSNIPLKQPLPETLEFDKESMQNLTIADLNEMNKLKKEERKKGKIQKLMSEVRKKLGMGREDNEKTSEKIDEETFINED